MGILIDYKYYKFIAIIPGWILGGFVGSISAFFLVKELIDNKEVDLFELSLLRLSSLLIMADGVADDREVKLVRTFFKKTFGDSNSARLFKALKQNPVVPKDIDSLLGIIKNKINPSKLSAIIQFFFAVSVADGLMSKSEEKFIFDIGVKLGFDRSRLESIRNQFINFDPQPIKSDSRVDNSLKVLGLKRGASAEQIKSAYRSLAKEFHPDKLSGVSEGIKNIAKERFQLIQESYEFLNKNYV